MGGGGIDAGWFYISHVCPSGFCWFQRAKDPPLKIYSLPGRCHGKPFRRLRSFSYFHKKYLRTIRNKNIKRCKPLSTVRYIIFIEEGTGLRECQSTQKVTKNFKYGALTIPICVGNLPKSRYGGQEPSRHRVVVPARQAMQLGYSSPNSVPGIDSSPHSGT